MWLVFLEQWNDTNIFLDIAPTNSPELEFSTDASGAQGYGAFFNNFWFQGKWSSQFHAHIEQQSIAWKELFPVYLACSVIGAIYGRVNVFYFGAIMFQLLKFSTQNHQKLIKLWT